MTLKQRLVVCMCTVDTAWGADMTAVSFYILLNQSAMLLTVISVFLTMYSKDKPVA